MLIHVQLRIIPTCPLSYGIDDGAHTRVDLCPNNNECCIGTRITDARSRFGINLVLLIVGQFNHALSFDVA